MLCRPNWHSQWRSEVRWGQSSCSWSRRRQIQPEWIKFLQFIKPTFNCHSCKRKDDKCPHAETQSSFHWKPILKYRWKNSPWHTGHEISHLWVLFQFIFSSFGCLSQKEDNVILFLTHTHTLQISTENKVVKATWFGHELLQILSFSRATEGRGPRLEDRDLLLHLGVQLLIWESLLLRSSD